MQPLKYPQLSKMRKSFATKVVALSLALFMLFNVGFPTAALALTGGPTQPEASGFQPVGTSDMVDLFTGDFKYNIPLLDMDGYPINLAYSGQVGMDEEASWVGLGWNVNPGAINRSMRGIPDDFNGESITREFNMKPNRTYSLNGGATWELFGYTDSSYMKPFSGTLSYNLGIGYNNYYGINIEQSIGVNLRAKAGPLTANLGVTSGSENGLTITPNVKMGLKLGENKDRSDNKLGFSVGTAFNTRAGVKQLTIGATIEKEYRKGNTTKTKEHELNGIFGGGGSFDLGMPTYTPQVSMPLHNVSISANFQAGIAFFGTHPSGFIGATYSGQKLITNEQSNPAYGYLHLDKGQARPEAILDFNRENDGEFTAVTPSLPVTSLTYDYLSVSGQGVGGSYRPFRSEIGHVFDAAAYTTSEGYNIGFEAGALSLSHIAGDVVVNTNYTTSGKWQYNNLAAERLRYGKKGSNPDHEAVYYKEASERSVDSDPDYYQKFGGKYAARFKMNQLSKFNVRLENEFEFDETSAKSVPAVNYRQKRDKRNQVIYPLTSAEVGAGFGLDQLHPSSYQYTSTSDFVKAHTAEITSYGTDGMRYVYGIAAYNTEQKEVSFAVGPGLYGSDAGTLNAGTDCSTGLVSYNPGSSNTASNPHGLDNFYSATKTPAYAHSYLLTAVLSPDYVDADNIKGPSIGDLGYYTKFSYTKTYSDYNWRTPVEANKANYNEGLKSDPTDDKGSYVYGKKEIWYLDKIESKNYIAVFHTADREDAFGVNGENGGVNSSQPLKLLKKISLYARKEYLANPATAVPIKEVHFVYDYSLCPGVPNNIHTSLVGEAELDENDVPINGKLTLKKVYFTYQNSNKARLSPYTFTYSTENPNYNAKAYDRWGHYKATTGNCGSAAGTLTAAEYPYVSQNQASANASASAWLLADIGLPSGGNIHVTYESDDYAYVQDKKAMQMFKLAGWGAKNSAAFTPGAPGKNITKDNQYLFFELQPGITDISQYISGVDKVYFKCMMKVLGAANSYEYVFGYADLDASDCGTYVNAGTTYGYVKLKGVKFDDNDPGPADKHPIVRTAVQYSRLHLSRQLYGDPSSSPSAGFGEALITELVTSEVVSTFIDNIIEILRGPNDYAFSDLGAGDQVVLAKSWIRLNNPNGKKLGGGSRVKRVEMSDSWAGMSSGSTSQTYGQDYAYTLPEGSSSGVAAYEPQLGGEENPFKQPITYNMRNALAPDNKMYQEAPLGESFFPSPTVGYSRVTVKNISRSQVTKHATGKVVHEFYTAKDFPTIVRQTDVVSIPEQQDPLSITSMLNIRSKSYLTATQGFAIECNDMHGKPKKQSVYQESQEVPITSVEYKYQSSPYGSGSFTLDNQVTVLHPNGSQGTATVGEFFDMVADMRQERSYGESTKLMINLDAFLVAVVPVAVPALWPSFSSEETQFRSATTTKVIQRFGILKETIAKDLGSVVSTKNLAYDAETGEVLVTQTKTDFNDDIYTLTYPAHWVYEKGMGQAYKNLGFEASLNFSGTGVAGYTNAAAYFVPGDELKLSNGVRAWVVDVQAHSIRAMKKDGSAVSGALTAKVIRSGRRNLPSVPVSSVTTLVNPLTNFQSNVFNNVLQASAIEFSDEWRTFCDCFGITETSTTINPYVLGTKGNWRAKKSLLHLSPRTQSNYNNNTHIRKDGVFTAYTPYYKLAGGKWQTDGKNWTYTSEVTEFSPYGQELENRDALGRYSAATFGYRQTFATSVAANARYRDIGFDPFEDYGFSPCADNHFKFTDFSDHVDDARSHSGRYSMKVSAGAAVSMNKTLTVCEPRGCNLVLAEETYTTLNKTVYTIQNGTGPYNIEYNILFGSPEVNLQLNGFILVGTGYKIEVIVTDAKGCKLTKVITKNA